MDFVRESPGWRAALALAAAWDDNEGALSLLRFPIRGAAMKKTAPLLLSLLTAGVLCSSVPANAGQTPTGTTSTPDTNSTAKATSAAATPADGAALPVSIDRIRKALTVPEPTGPPIQKTVDGEAPRFIVQTQAPRTITLRSYLDDGTAVPGYVRSPFDPYHAEFLDMVTPDAAKGCAQFSDQGCAEVMSSRVVSGLVWQQLFSRFKQPQQQ
jgi:hypothetical protein